MFETDTLPETNIAPENRPSQKGISSSNNPIQVVNLLFLIFTLMKRMRTFVSWKNFWFSFTSETTGLETTAFERHVFFWVVFLKAPFCLKHPPKSI